MARALASTGGVAYRQENLYDPEGRELANYDGADGYWWGRNVTLGNRNVALYFSNYAGWRTHRWWCDVCGSQGLHLQNLLMECSLIAYMANRAMYAPPATREDPPP